MQILKEIHVFCAYTTGVSFLLRGVLAIFQCSWNQHRIVKTLPHVIDTFLFFSGLLLAFSWMVSPASQMWLLTKIAALLVYIAFGLLMLRWGDTAGRRWVGLLGGLLVYMYIIGVAHHKTVLSFFA